MISDWKKYGSSNSYNYQRQEKSANRNKQHKHAKDNKQCYAIANPTYQVEVEAEVSLRSSWDEQKQIWKHGFHEEINKK